MRKWKTVIDAYRCPCCEQQPLVVVIEENDSGDEPDFSWEPMRCACAETMQIVEGGDDWWYESLWQLAENYGWRIGEWDDDNA